MGNPDYKIEINELMSLAEKKFGRRLNVSNGFEELALLLGQEVRAGVSVSTLKRLYGYVGDVHAPRMSTLDILAQYVGHADFHDFCQWLRREKSCSSQFFSASELSVSCFSVSLCFCIFFSSLATFCSLSYFSYASTILVTSLWRTMSFLFNSTKLMPFTPLRIFMAWMRPEVCEWGRSI